MNLRDPKQKVHEYLSNRDQYFINAQEFASKGEFKKASEFLWGAVALQIKLLALVKKNIRLGRHEDLRRFIRELSKELGDEEIRKSFEVLEKLHINFYDEIISPEDFEFYFKEAIKFMKRLEDLMKN